MLSTQSWSWLIRIVVALLLPTVMCFGYYSLDAVQEQSGPLPLLVAVSYPLTILGLVAMAAILLSRRVSKRWLALAALCFALPAAILILVRS
jgi:hypothetical protein